MKRRMSIKPKTYDFYLMIATAAVLTVIGLVCLYGIGYYSYTDSILPQWTQTSMYGEYIDSMNNSIYPFLVILLVVLGLCIPKRVVPRHYLLAVGVAILGITGAIALSMDIEASMGFLLGVTAAIQTGVLVMTALGGKGLTFEREGYFIQTGSSMLHLGVVIFVLDFVSMRNSTLHLSVFWVATILITAGIVMSFYPDEVRRIIKIGNDR